MRSGLCRPVRVPEDGVFRGMWIADLYFGSLVLVLSSSSWRRARAEAGTHARSWAGHPGEGQMGASRRWTQL